MEAYQLDPEPVIAVFCNRHLEALFAFSEDVYARMSFQFSPAMRRRLIESVVCWMTAWFDADEGEEPVLPLSLIEGYHEWLDRTEPEENYFVHELASHYSFQMEPFLGNLLRDSANWDLPEPTARRLEEQGWEGLLVLMARVAELFLLDLLLLGASEEQLRRAVEGKAA